jgi:hypothetical protein
VPIPQSEDVSLKLIFLLISHRDVVINPPDNTPVGESVSKFCGAAAGKCKDYRNNYGNLFYFFQPGGCSAFHRSLDLKTV